MSSTTGRSITGKIGRSQAALQSTPGAKTRHSGDGTADTNSGMANIYASRMQLTLFVEGTHSEIIENIRREYNPAQYALIKCHVTLCREDELQNIDQVLYNLSQIKALELRICFGEVIRFDEGKGVMLPAEGPNEAFQQLRKTVLQGVVDNPRIHQPHITLMHPRNATCTDEIFAAISSKTLPTCLEFKKISLIEQHMGRAWHNLMTF